MTESGYGRGEAAVAAVVAQATGFTTATVTRANWRVLNKGLAALYAVVLQEGQPERVFEGHNLVTERCQTRVQIWRRYKDDGSSYTNLLADVETALAKIDQYPHLGDTTGYVLDSNAIIAGPVMEMWTKAGGPGWLRQDVLVRWVSQRIVSFLD